MNIAPPRKLGKLPVRPGAVEFQGICFCSDRAGQNRGWRIGKRCWQNSSKAGRGSCEKSQFKKIKESPHAYQCNALSVRPQLSNATVDSSTCQL